MWSKPTLFPFLAVSPWAAHEKWKSVVFSQWDDSVDLLLQFLAPSLIHHSGIELSSFSVTEAYEWLFQILTHLSYLISIFLAGHLLKQFHKSILLLFTWYPWRDHPNHRATPTAHVISHFLSNPLFSFYCQNYIFLDLSASVSSVNSCRLSSSFSTLYHSILLWDASYIQQRA